MRRCNRTIYRSLYDLKDVVIKKILLNFNKSQGNYYTYLAGLQKCEHSCKLKSKPWTMNFGFLRTTSKSLPLLYCLSLVFALWLNKATCLTYIYNRCICSYIYSDQVYFRYSCQNITGSKRVVNFRFGLIPDYASDFCLGLSVGPPA